MLGLLFDILSEGVNSLSHFSVTSCLFGLDVDFFPLDYEEVMGAYFVKYFCFKGSIIFAHNDILHAPLL